MKHSPSLRFSSKPKKTSPVRTLVAVGLALLFVLGVLQLVQGLVDTERAKKQLIETLAGATGQEVLVRGKVTFSVLPTPTFYFSDIELRNPEGGTQPELRASMLAVEVSWGDVFSDAPRFAAAALTQPELDITRAQSGVVGWGWLAGGLARGDALPAVVSWSGGRVIYHDLRADRLVQLDGFQGKVSGANARQFDAAFTYLGTKLNVDAKLEPTDVASKNAFTFAIGRDAENKLSLSGTVDLDEPTLHAEGELALVLADVQALAHAAAGTAPSPITLAAKWSLADEVFDFSELSFDALGAKASGTAQAQFNDGKPTLALDLAFDALPLSPLRALAAPFVSGANTKAAVLPNDITLKLTARAKEASLGVQKFKDMQVDTVLDEGVITVNQLVLTTPDDAHASLFGVVSKAPVGGLRFEGAVDAQGESLRETLAQIDPSALELPTSGFGTYSLRSNMFISADQLRLSEAQLRIDTLALGGGMVAYFDEKPRIEAEIRLAEFNFDFFRDQWRERNLAMEGANQEGLGSAPLALLSKLTTTVDFKVTADRFTFLERSGNTVSFRFYAENGKFGLYNLRFDYPDETTVANLTVDMHTAKPEVTLMFNTRALDLAYFDRAAHVGRAEVVLTPKTETPAESPKRQAGKEWSQELVDVQLLDQFNGTFDISIGRLRDGARSFDNVKFKGALRDSKLALETLTFGYWGGQCSVNGSLFGGKVPGVSLGYTLANIEVSALARELLGFENMAGRINVNGTLATSGVNYLSWVSQADAKILFAARGVTVQGFNITRVQETVSVSRTAADVANNVMREIVRGASALSVDGQMNIAQGIARTPGLTVNSGTVTGSMNGELSLVPWTLDSTALFQFPELTTETVPTLTATLSGSLDAPTLNIDTSSLEAHVAKRITGK